MRAATRVRPSLFPHRRSTWSRAAGKGSWGRKLFLREFFQLTKNSERTSCFIKTHIKMANPLKPAKLTAGRFFVDGATCSSNHRGLSIREADSVALLQLSEHRSGFTLTKGPGWKRKKKRCKETCTLHNLRVSWLSKRLLWQKYKTYLNIADTLRKWPFQLKRTLMHCLHLKGFPACHRPEPAPLWSARLKTSRAN